MLGGINQRLIHRLLIKDTRLNSLVRNYRIISTINTISNIS